MVEFLGQIGGPGMDAEISKMTQKVLTKQGMKFKLNTKVLGGDDRSENVKLEVEAAKGGKKETVIYILLHRYRPMLTMTSSMQMWSLLPSGAAPIPRA